MGPGRTADRLVPPIGALAVLLQSRKLAERHEQKAPHSFGAPLAAPRRSIMPKRGRTHGKTKRILESRDESTVFEGAKGLMCIRGTKSTDELRSVLRDLSILTKPHSKTFMRRNLIRPFEDAEPVEFLSQKNGTGLFAVASHSKKRPFNLVFGRCFGGKLLDMVELGLTGVGSLSEAPTAGADMSAPVEDVEGDADSEAPAAAAAAAAGSSSSAVSEARAATPQIGMRPCMIFVGAGWETDPRFATMRNIFLDMFRGVPVRPGDGMLLTSFSWCICVTQASADAFHLRSYTIDLRRSGTKTPKVALRDMGFHMDASLRRYQPAEAAMMKAATTLPAQARASRKKNMSKDAVGDTYGRVHMERQDFSTLKLRANRASKFDRRERRSGADAEGDGAAEAEEAGGERAKRSRRADA